MIVKDEEKVIERCLDSVKNIVDEIIVVDTGSTDRTEEICKKYTNKIYHLPWKDDFASARNYSFSKASKDYILWLDADDVILSEDNEKFVKLKETLTEDVDSVQMNYVLSRDKKGNVTSSLMRNRLVKKSKRYRWVGAVHEYLDVFGHVMKSDISITHLSEKEGLSSRNLKIYNKMREKGVEFTPRDLYYYANECYEHGLYTQAYHYYRKFIDTNQGWIEDYIGAFEKGTDSLIQLSNLGEAEKFAYESFLYDLPRANLCCKLGYIFFAKDEIDKAIYWYKAATLSDLERVKQSGAFINYAYYTWIPHIQLCVCYDRKGLYHLSYYHNEMARMYQPDDVNVLQNKKYLEDLIGKIKQSNIDAKESTKPLKESNILLEESKPLVKETKTSPGEEGKQ